MKKIIMLSLVLLNTSVCFSIEQKSKRLAQGTSFESETYIYDSNQKSLLLNFLSKHNKHGGQRKNRRKRWLCPIGKECKAGIFSLGGYERNSYAHLLTHFMEDNFLNVLYVVSVVSLLFLGL